MSASHEAWPISVKQQVLLSVVNLYHAGDDILDVPPGTPVRPSRVGAAFLVERGDNVRDFAAIPDDRASVCLAALQAEGLVTREPTTGGFLPTEAGCAAGEALFDDAVTHFAR